MESTDSGRITRNPETPPNFFGSEASQKGKSREWPFHVPPCAIVRECGSVEGAELGEFTISLMPPAVFSDLEGDLHGALFFRLYVDPNPLSGQTAAAAILSRLEYASVKGFYLLHRSVSQRVQITIRERLVPTDDPA
jgi:hypothetical protein